MSHDVIVQTTIKTEVKQTMNNNNAKGTVTVVLVLVLQQFCSDTYLM